MNLNSADSVIVYRILQLLSTPIKESKAFKLGLIDGKGKQVKIPKNKEEKESFTLLNRLVFRLQNLISRSNPNGESDLKNIATSTYLVKECIENNIEPLNLEIIYRNALNVLDQDDVNEFREFLENVPIPYCLFEDAPINNSMATPGIERPEIKLMGSKQVKKQVKKKATRIIL